MTRLEEILADAGETIGVRRIYGEPYEKNGVTVIPAARVMGGAGGGGATEAGASDTPADSPNRAGIPATGSGVGFGMRGGPVGAFVIKGDEVKWVPAVDINRLILGFQIALIVFLFVRRSMVKTRAKATLDLAKLNRAPEGMGR